MPLYFAYGSNMDVAAMAKRCPRSKPLGRARLPRRRFALMADGYATVVEDPRRFTLGLLWDLAFADLPALDRYEGLAEGLYFKIDQPVIPEGGATRRALIYIGRAGAGARPARIPGYMEGVVEAAKSAGLPADYVAGLAACAPWLYAGGASAGGAPAGGRAIRWTPKPGPE